jgi:DNA-binding XRE family transcriptional regulator
MVFGTDGKSYGDHIEECEISVDVGAYLKSYRKERGLLQEEMAWILGINKSSYIRREHNEVDMTLREYLILQKVKMVWGHTEYHEEPYPIKKIKLNNE